jgi:hypothetical protein
MPGLEKQYSEQKQQEKRLPERMPGREYLEHMVEPQNADCHEGHA